MRYYILNELKLLTCESVLRRKYNQHEVLI
jgi:hypothetical protein